MAIGYQVAHPIARPKAHPGQEPIHGLTGDRHPLETMKFQGIIPVDRRTHDLFGEMLTRETKGCEKDLNYLVAYGL
jgi:hypothetical protein